MPKKYNKKKRILFIFLAAAIFVFIVFLKNPFSVKDYNIEVKVNEGTNIGDKAPNFKLADINGNEVMLSNFQGKKAVVVNFWATWCPPCREEMPLFEEIYAENKGKVEIFGINLQESERAVNNFLKAVPVTYPLLLDPSGDVKKAYNVFTQPVTYFIDKNGIIVDKKLGPLEEKEIEEKFARIGVN